MEKSRRGIQSVEIAARLLQAMARHVKAMALKDVAQAAGISAAKAHPYMVSFLNTGFVQQDGATGFYELGPLALQLGLAKLQRLDPVKEAEPSIAALAEATGQSIALVVWGNLGPTVVRLEEPTQPMHVNLRTGTVMSLMNTATGRLFAAYMPPKVVDKAMQGEPVRMGHASAGVPVTVPEFDALVAETRRMGLSRSLGMPIPGIDAFCAPVFDSAGNIVLGMLAMGPSATFDRDWDGRVARALRVCAREVSRRLGYEEPAQQSARVAAAPMSAGPAVDARPAGKGRRRAA